VSIVCTIKEKFGKAGDFTVGKITLNYTFNNPNSVENTAEMLLKLFIEANKPKVEEAIKNAVNNSEKVACHPV
jgi:hypothetical protein